MRKNENIKHYNRIFPSKSLLMFLIVAVITLLFFVVFLFTRPALMPAFNLSDKGQIGDAINGITGPIIALISSGLLFYSFQAQLEANKRQLEANKTLKSQWEFDTYYRLYGEIEKAYLENLFLEERKVTFDNLREETFKGAGYLKYVADILIPRTKNKLSEDSLNILRGRLDSIEFILEDLIVLIDYVRTSDVDQKLFFLHRAERFYSARLEQQLKPIYSNLPISPLYERSGSIYNSLIKTISQIRENELKDFITVISVN